MTRIAEVSPEQPSPASRRHVRCDSHGCSLNNPVRARSQWLFRSHNTNIAGGARGRADRHCVRYVWRHHGHRTARIDRLDAPGQSRQPAAPGLFVPHPQRPAVEIIFVLRLASPAGAASFIAASLVVRRRVVRRSSPGVRTRRAVIASSSSSARLPTVTAAGGGAPYKAGVTEAGGGCRRRRRSVGRAPVGAGGPERAAGRGASVNRQTAPVKIAGQPPTADPPPADRSAAFPARPAARSVGRGGSPEPPSPERCQQGTAESAGPRWDLARGTRQVTGLGLT